MIFVRQGYQAVILVTLTLILQSAGMAALIQWIKAQFPNGIHRLGLFRSFLLVVRFTSLLLLIWLLQQAPIGSVEGCPDRRFRRRFANFKPTSPVKRPASSTWRLV